MNTEIFEDIAYSKRGEMRYVVVDTDTGEIIDDCNGYGYKTKDAARLGWNYKQKQKNCKSESYPFF